MAAKGTEKGSTFLLSHQRLQRPQADLYVFRVEGRDAEKSISATFSEIPIVWYCYWRCETQLSVLRETLDVSVGGLLSPSGVASGARDEDWSLDQKTPEEWPPMMAVPAIEVLCRESLCSVQLELG